MALPSDWKMGKCLEWYTEVPFDGRPRESPVFLIQNIQCFIQFCKIYCNGYKYLDLYLKPKTSHTKLKSFSLKIYSDHVTTGNLVLTNVSFHDANKLLSIPDTTIVNRGGQLTNGCFIRFIFVFGNEDGLSLPLETKTGEKSIQADLVLSLQTDIEYLSLDFGQLLEKKDHSDVQLLCNGGSIPAHRAILAARSKAFSDMFQENTSESQSGLVNLAATELSVMELCLEFIYKGKISKLPIEIAPNLYVLGHVLKITSLTKMCADLMLSNVCEDSYITNLVLADKYDDDYFKCGLIDYISDHVEWLKSEKWMQFSDKCMKTAIDVYRKCMFK